MKEQNIDCMKYRKSTHLAGVDVDMMIEDNGKCILTIKDAYYQKNVNVSGNKTDGYFLEFTQDVKPMVVNSTNRKTISNIVKINTKCTTTESRNIGNWNGTSIELYFDSSIKMMGKTTGGIRIKTVSAILNIDDKKALAILNESKKLEDLKINWSKLSVDEQKLPTVISLKENLKLSLK